MPTLAGVRGGGAMARAPRSIQSADAAAPADGPDSVYIITGWGRHNPNGNSPIKMAVHHLLQKKQYTFKLENRGMFKVQLRH